MSGTFPTAGFTALDLQSNTNSRLTQSVSGQTQRLKSGAQYWSFKLKSPPLSRSDFNAIFSFIVQQDTGGSILSGAACYLQHNRHNDRHSHSGRC